jgi:hypothetical protein
MLGLAIESHGLILAWDTHVVEHPALSETRRERSIDAFYDRLCSSSVAPPDGGDDRRIVPSGRRARFCIFLDVTPLRKSIRRRRNLT